MATVPIEKYNELARKYEEIDVLETKASENKMEVAQKIETNQRESAGKQKELHDYQETISKDIEEIKKKWNEELIKTDDLKRNHKIMTKEFIHQTIKKLKREIEEIEEKHDKNTKVLSKKIAKEEDEMNQTNSKDIQNLLEKYQFELLLTHEQ